MLRPLPYGLLFGLLALGCDRIVGEAKATEPPHAADAGAKKPHADAGAQAEKKSDGHAAHDGGSVRYGVPFAWETSKDEPLAKTRGFLSELLTDNRNHVALGAAHFKPFGETQSPRATVVTCSDSRVQADAWDSTAENDDFTIRNIGNQVENAHGSVEYGLEHLHTPVLLILGHTGCGAVKAAMGKLDGLEAPIRAELKGLKVPQATGEKIDRKAWAEAVVANVNHQVDFAVTHFGPLLREGRLTVVGAVYDFRNDMGKGHGRINIVNVNANVEPERLAAFQAALKTPGETAGATDAERAPIGRPLPNLEPEDIGIRGAGANGVSPDDPTANMTPEQLKQLEAHLLGKGPAPKPAPKPAAAPFAKLVDLSKPHGDAPPNAPGKAPSPDGHADHGHDAH